MIPKYIQNAKRIVIKIGSALLFDPVRGEARKDWMKALAADVAALHSQGSQVLLISSGSIALGRRHLGLSNKTIRLEEKQAAAATGQVELAQLWSEALADKGLRAGQILLAPEDTETRRRHINARATIQTLLDLGVVPVVNENDTVATDEIRFGDNDALGALATNLLEADVLIILTDQDGFFDKDPRFHSDAQLIPEARALDDRLLGMAGKDGSALGRGGMYTKIMAAQQAARSGAMTVIANGRTEGVLELLRSGESVGSLLYPDLKPQAARKRWLASHKQTRGILVIDAGAADALKAKGRSLLPVGVTEVRGVFDRGDIVAIETTDGERLATGLVNYGSTQALEMFGKTTKQLNENQLLMEGDALVHRDNMALI